MAGDRSENQHDDPPVQNWRVVLRGSITTEVDMLAVDDFDAMRKAEQWAQGRHLPSQFNHIDIVEVFADEAEVSEDQTVLFGSYPHPGADQP